MIPINQIRKSIRSLVMDILFQSAVAQKIKPPKELFKGIEKSCIALRPSKVDLVEVWLTQTFGASLIFEMEEVLIGWVKTQLSLIKEGVIRAN